MRGVGNDHGVIVRLDVERLETNQFQLVSAHEQKMVLLVVQRHGPALEIVELLAEIECKREIGRMVVFVKHRDLQTPNVGSDGNQSSSAGWFIYFGRE